MVLRKMILDSHIGASEYGTCGGRMDIIVEEVNFKEK